MSEPNIKAPIILDVSEIDELLALEKSLRQHQSVQIAEKEAERIASYFNAMSTWLLQAAQPSAFKSQYSMNMTRPALEADALRMLFNEMTRTLGPVLLSEVVIMPDNIQKMAKAAHLFKRQFKQLYNVGDHSFHFGFSQVPGNANTKQSFSSATFSLSLLDHKMMQAVRLFHPMDLLEDLQYVMSLVNHDMLHHFTSPYLNDTVAVTQNNRNKQAFINNWVREIPRFDSYGPYVYEDWAMVSHENILLMPENAFLLEELPSRLCNYFDELERISHAIRNENGVSSKIAVQKSHEAADYFGMVMLHTMTRVFPLNHPLMSYSLDRMQRMDPLPEKAIEACYRTFLYRLAKAIGKFLPSPNPSVMFSEVARRLQQEKPLSGIFQSYKQLGFDIHPDGPKDYRRLKLVQLTQFSLGEVRTHIPEPNPVSGSLRAQLGYLNLEMVRAAAMTVT